VIDSNVVATAYVTLSLHRFYLGELLTNAAGTTPEAIQRGTSTLEIVWHEGYHDVSSKGQILWFVW
jgi:hypothetical protein